MDSAGFTGESIPFEVTWGTGGACELRYLPSVSGMFDLHIWSFEKVASCQHTTTHTLQALSHTS